MYFWCANVAGVNSSNRNVTENVFEIFKNLIHDTNTWKTIQDTFLERIGEGLQYEGDVRYRKFLHLFANLSVSICHDGGTPAQIDNL